MGRVILVASGKGGVGKTTLSANLAAVLADINRKTLVIDADIRLSNLDIVMGIREKKIFDLQDIFLKRCNHDIVEVHPFHENLHILSAPYKLEAKPQELFVFIKNLLLQLTTEYDYILVDCPSGIGSSLDLIIDKSFEMLIVATPDLTSVSDAEKTAFFASNKGIKNLHLIVNRIRPSLIKRELAPDIDMIIDSTSIPLLGCIPEDIKVICSENTGKLAVDIKRARSKKAFMNIAKRIDGQDIELYKFK